MSDGWLDLLFKILVAILIIWLIVFFVSQLA